MRKTRILLLIVSGIIFAPALRAQEPPKAGFRAEFIAQMDDVMDKLVRLAEATPDEKFAWRPADGVRSVSEVYMHIVGGNYFLLKFAGVEPPASFSRDLEKTVTGKAKVIETVRQSMEHVRTALLKTSDADLDKPAEFFGQKTTIRGIYFALANHMHEHLGQSVAYARVNGVVPPWSN